MKSLRPRRDVFRTVDPRTIVLGTAAALTLGEGSGTAESKRFVYNKTSATAV